MASAPEGVVYTFYIMGTDNDMISQKSLDVYTELPNFIQKKHLYNEKLYSGWSVYNKATNNYDALIVDSTSGEVVPNPDSLNYLLGSGASQHIELRAQIVENFPLSLQYGLLDNIYNTQDGTLRSAYALAPGSLRLGYNDNRAMLFWDSGTKRMPVSAEIKWSDILGVPAAAVMAIDGTTGNLAVTRADGETQNIDLPYLPYRVQDGVSKVEIPLTFTDTITFSKKLLAKKGADFEDNISVSGNITATGTLTIDGVFTPKKVDTNEGLAYVFGVSSSGTGVMIKRALTDLTVGTASTAAYATNAGSATTAESAGSADVLITPHALSISGIASDSAAPTFNGSSDITLLIPKILSGFTSITATDFIGNLTGKATSAGSADSANTAGHAATAGSADSANTANSAGQATKLANARSIAISGSASDGTAPTFDGSAGITLLIPKTLTNFTSITSTKFVGALEGKADTAGTADTAGYATSAGSATTAGTAGKFHSIEVQFTPANAALTPDKLYSDFLGGNCFSARRGSWYYAGNGYIAKGDTAATQCPFGAIDLAGTSILQWATTNTQYTQLYITAPTADTTHALTGEMIYFVNNGSGYSPTWYRVLTNKNFNSYAPKKDGTGASGTWGISISGNAATATTATNAGYATSAGSSAYPAGFSSNSGNITWGTLAGDTTTTTGYRTIARWDTANGGSVAFADGPMNNSTTAGKTSMQIDGYFYQEEGAYQVLDNRYMENRIDSSMTSPGYVHMKTRLVVKGNGGSYNEGIRVLPASNGWSNIYFSDNDALSGTNVNGWLLGRRGANGAVSGSIGDFTIECNNSDGRGLTLFASGGARVNGSIISAGSFKGDTSSAAIRPSDSNEINIGSNANYIYIGYENRTGSSGAVSEYYFGQHNGAANAKNGNIYSGSITASRFAKIGNVQLQYNSAKECLDFIFS